MGRAENDDPCPKDSLEAFGESERGCRRNQERCESEVQGARSRRARR